MVSVITSFSRITILSYIIIFTVIDLIQIFEPKLNEVVGSILTTIQAVMIVLFLCNSAAVIYFAKENPYVILTTVFQLIFLTVIAIFLNNLSVPASKALINNMLLMLCFSFVFIERLNFNKSIRQLINGVVSLVVAVIVIYFLRKIPEISKYLFVFAAIGIVSLLAISFIGDIEYGARLSFNVLGIRIQPSEIVKITYLFFIAGCIVTFRDFRGYLFSTIGAGMHVLVLVHSKDLGTALVFLAAYVFLTFIAYKNYILLGLEIGGAIVGGIIAFNAFPHIQTRFIAWLDPLSVVDDKGYQISQSLFAIGTGGWLGSGICNGMPAKIPVVVSDFIFAAISEEMGAIVAICLIIIYMCSTIMFLNCAFNCSNSFYMLVVSGIAIIFGIQTILNIGGVIKFIPSTGVTLPFISYGGSSLLSMFIGFFIAESSEELWISAKGRRRYDY
ncbi:FtsW/RodA/SpoVE family cell cycle protein [Pseudobutyrivibrio xylanivorans]|uniref:Cell division protein FtsW, lipid II flippase n=1 Tax=Pseudobutyrivibrio xylanivorans DSM 14809 TaxID=1123012 RepID=A0A1M6J7H5_PSEXY|nr:FtsW/RodA/SpoVE family cell cycle protein [Pseudobutyrivibrio xylanivorans]SHJ42615.1 cell division protein FtsW, lipid II flippase [Pseudobutyrivibrio xylanivorans DSM 14809]